MKLRRSATVAGLLALVASTAVAAVALSASPLAHAQGPGFQTSGTQLLDANGNPFIIRGTSLPHVWYTQNSPAMFNDASSLGANSVRVVLGSGHQWGPSLDVANVIGWCKQNQLICTLEVHDATGFGEQAAAVSILDVVDDYWAHPTVRDAVQGEEAYVLVNIANEPRGNQNAAAWVDETVQAIQGMRELGYTHTLVVDAPNWGQDWQFVMRDNAPQIAAADPLGNTLFSIHMYEVFGSAQNVISYLDAFEQMNLPLIIGEFGHEHNGQPVDEQTIMSQAQQRGVGWYAWSWSGNTEPYLDQVVNFNPNNLTAWGQTVFLGPNGIQQTAQRASVFNGTTPPPPSPPPSTPPPSTPPPPSPSPPPPTGGCAVSAYDVNNWGGDPGFTATVTVTNTSSATITGWTVQWTWPAGQTVNDHWSSTITQTGSSVTAANAPWNGTLAPNQSTSFGFNGRAASAGNNPAPSQFTCTTS